MLTFDNFEAIFTKSDKPIWRLYKGQTKSQQIGSSEKEYTNIADSLNDLREIVTLYGQGIYTVELRKSDTASRGNDIHTFVFGDPNTVGATKGTATAQPAHPAASFFQGLDARYFMDMANSNQQRLVEMQMQNMRLEMELRYERMNKKNKEEKLTGFDRLAGVIEKNPAIIERTFDLLSGQPAALGTLKAEKPIPPNKKKEAPAGNPDDDMDEEEDDDEGYTPGVMSLDAAYRSLTVISKALPKDKHINDVLDNLALLAQDNPEMFLYALNKLV